MELSFEKMKQIAQLGSTHDLIFQITNGELHILYFSESTAYQFGYTVDDFAKIKKKDGFLFNFESKEEIDKLREEVLGIINTEKIITFNIYVRHKSGEYVLASGKITYLGEHNNYPTLLAILDDETGKIRSQNLQLAIANELRYKNVISFANILVWDYNISDNYIFNDNGWIETFGLNTSHLSMPYGFTDNGFVALDDIPEFNEAYNKLHNGSRDVTYDCWLTFPGKSTPSYWHTRYRVEPNEPNIAHAISVNLTEQKNAEISYAHRIASLVKNNMDSIASFQLNISKNQIKTIYCNNDPVNKLTNAELYDEFLTKYLDLMVNKLDKIKLINAFSRGNLIASFEAGNFSAEYEHMLSVDKNNMPLFCRTSANFIKNPVSGDIEGVLQIDNVHEQVLMNRIVSSTVEKDFIFLALVHIPTERAIIIDHRIHPDGHISKDNFLTGFEKNIKLLLGKNITDDIIRAISLDNVINRLEMEDFYSYAFNTHVDYDDNKHIVLNYSYENRKNNTLFITCRDVTDIYNAEIKQKNELKEALQVAQKANRAKSEFLSLVSHDIRTPLNGIMGMTDLALDEEMSDRARYFLEKAKTSTMFLSELINDLLDVSRIELGKIVLNPEIYDYEEFVNYIDAVIKPLYAQKNITFELIPAGYDAPLYVDKLRFNQIMFNILSNAYKYTPNNGHVSLKIEIIEIGRKKIEGKFIISDNGIGMSEEFKERIFESFAQENRDRNYMNMGSGLGLSIVKNLVDLMNGSISVESEIDKGSTFTVTFESKKVTKSDKINENDNKDDNEDFNVLEGKNVLIFEDNEINMEIIREILGHYKINTDAAFDGVEGLRIFTSHPSGYYDAILMDVRMPKLNGIETTIEMRKITKLKGHTVPIIAMTANAMNEDKEECINSGMNDFLTKPINADSLLKTLCKYCSKKK